MRASAETRENLRLVRGRQRASTFQHFVARYVPGGVDWVRNAEGLAEAQDMLLRLRRGKIVGSGLNWCTVPALGEDQLRGSGLVTVNRRTMEDAIACGGSVAVGLGLGSMAMIGVNELMPDVELLTAVDASGQPNADGQFLGVGVHLDAHEGRLVLGTTMGGGPLVGRYLATLPSVYLPVPHLSPSITRI